MKSEIATALDSALTQKGETGPLSVAELPESLVETVYIECELRAPTRCQKPDVNCTEYVDIERSSAGTVITCERGHEVTIDTREFLYGNPVYEKIFAGVVDALNEDETQDWQLDTVDTRPLPQYARAELESNARIYLVLGKGDFDAAIREICLDVVTDDIPSLLFTPSNEIDDILRTTALFSSGNLIYVSPFDQVENGAELSYRLEQICDVATLENKVLRDRHGENAHDVVYRVQSNPRYVLSELNQMLLLRRNGEIKRGSGDRLEKITESALSYIFPTYPGEGGEDSSGENLPDSVFLIDRVATKNDRILGIVDSKSSKKTRMAEEETEGKHVPYLDRARDNPILNQDCTAHIFATTNLSGRTELDFVEHMDYQEDEYLVLLTVDALAILMSAYLSSHLNNEIRLAEGDFRKFAYPLFHQESFQEEDYDDYTRELYQNQGEYDREYWQHEDLLIVTKEIVMDRLEEYIDEEGDYEQILSGYY